MGLLSWLGYDRAYDLAASSAVVQRGVATPFPHTGELAKVTIEDLFGLEVSAVTRSEAMSIPAIAKARELICTTLSRQPLVSYKDATPLTEQPTWLYRTDSAVGPRMRTLWVLDDLLFYGWSLLATHRGADGQILDAARIGIERWRFDGKGNVLVDDQPVNSEQVILIPGVHEGLLKIGARTIRGARLLEDQWTARVKNPVPVVEIRVTGDADLDRDEMTQVRNDYITARNDPNGTVMVTPNGLEVHAHGDNALDLFVEGRNSVAVDVARLTNLPANMLDAANVNASSVNYTNETIGRSEFADLSLRSWALPLEERLSQDDCTARGTYIAFDLSAFAITDTGSGPVLKD